MSQQQETIYHEESPLGKRSTSPSIEEGEEVLMEGNISQASEETTSKKQCLIQAPETSTFEKTQTNWSNSLDAEYFLDGEQPEDEETEYYLVEITYGRDGIVIHVPYAIEGPNHQRTWDNQKYRMPNLQIYDKQYRSCPDQTLLSDRYQPKNGEECFNLKQGKWFVYRNNQCEE